MAYRLRYTVAVDWIAPGIGAMGGSPAVLAGELGSSGTGQTLEINASANTANIQGTGTGGALASADVTTLTNAMAADVAAQMNAILARLAGFATGGA